MSNKVRGTSVKVLPNGIVMHGRGCGHKQVPDGMGKRNDAIALEEHNSQAVNQTPAGELLKAVCVGLSTEAKGKAGCYFDVTRSASPSIPPPQRLLVCYTWKHKTHLTCLIPLDLEYPLDLRARSDHWTHSRLHRTKWRFSHLTVYLSRL